MEKKEKAAAKKVATKKATVAKKSAVEKNSISEKNPTAEKVTEKKSERKSATAKKTVSAGSVNLMENSGEYDVEISIVIPVFNEQENMETLSSRVLKTMDDYGHSYELIFVDDGSSDKTPQMLRDLFKKRSDVIRVISFNGNYGQYVAILAGFEHVRGGVVVTLDADLQNLPEEIPDLLEKMKEGLRSCRRISEKTSR